MTLFDKPIGDISEDDLQALVNGQDLEQKTLEYKSKLAIGTDGERKEFLCDVSSFANAVGGCLVYGITESRGGAIGLIGLDEIDPDNKTLQLTQIIHEGIQPRIAGLTIRPIKLQNGRYVIIIRVPQSYAAPHMVNLKGASRFCARHSNGRYNLDVHELRQAFLLSAAVGERIRDFRLERVARLGADETPLPLEESKSKLIVHILPFTSFSTNQPIDVVNLGNRFHEFFRDVNNRRYNIDGAVFFVEYKDGVARKYYQVFRNGAVEFSEGDLTRNIDGKPYIASEIVEDEILAACKSTFSFLKSFSVEPPVFISVTLTGLKGVILPTKNFYLGATAFDRDVILIPEVQMDKYPENDDELIKIMKPALDSMWNAGGRPGSESFNNKGRWQQ